MSADTDKLIAQARDAARAGKEDPLTWSMGLLLGALADALEQAEAERVAARRRVEKLEAVIAKRTKRAEATEADLARARGTVEMYRANIDTLARSLPSCTLKQRLLELNEDARDALAAGSGDGR